MKLVGSRLLEKRRNEPQPDMGRPAMPKGMADEAADVWEQICPLLEDMGVLTIADGNALIRYCNLFARLWRANQHIQQHGETYPIYEEDRYTGEKEISRHQKWPQVTIERDISAQLLRLEQEFGLTPAARAGLSVEKKTTGLPKRKQG